MSGSIVDRFRAVYQELDRNNLHLLAEVYAPDVVFIDPVHRVEGLPALTEYFRRMYDGVAEIEFRFEDVISEEERAFLTWEMNLRHRRFKPGETLTLPGATAVRFGERVHFHRDYFDLGAMIYERIPVLGGAVRAIKARL